MKRSVSVAVAVAFQALLVAAPQRETPGRPAFEAATIKLSTGASAANIVTQPSPNRLLIPRMTLKALIYVAYGDGGFNTSMSVRGGPDWANQTVYAVEGVAAAPATPRQMRLMQSLLEGRFALKLRDDSQTDDALGNVLTLVVDRADGALGPKVKPWDGTCPRPSMNIQLTPREVTLYSRPVRGRGGYQTLLRRIQQQISSQGVLDISDADLGKLIRYSFQYGEGGFQDRSEPTAKKLMPGRKRVSKKR